MTTPDEKKKDDGEAPLLPWLLLLALPTLIGLLASAILVVDYSHPVPLFCNDHGGCEAVRHTPFAILPLVGVPTPWLGLAAFFVFAVLLFAKGSRARTLHWALALMGSILAVLFITVQARIGAFCKYCMMVDLSTLVLLAGATRRRTLRWDPPTTSIAKTLTAVGAALAAGTPLALGFLGEAPIPKIVSEEIAKVPKGQVLVVDFADFECPHCRAVHAKLKAVLPSFAGRVHLERRHIPLGRIHPHAEAAARAAICAEEQSEAKGERMADLLFTESPTKLTKEGCESIALAAELDVEAYKACVASDRPDKRIEADRERFKESNGLGLPTIWIGRKDFRGSGFEESDYRQAIEAALAK